MLKLLALAALVVPLAAPAQGRWTVFTTTIRDNGFTADVPVSIDLSSIKPQGKYRKAWFRFDMGFTPLVQGQWTYDEQLDLIYFDCASGSFSKKQIVTFLRGVVVYNSSIPESMLSFQDAVPDSVGSLMMDQVCRKRLP